METIDQELSHVNVEAEEAMEVKKDRDRSDSTDSIENSKWALGLSGGLGWVLGEQLDLYWSWMVWLVLEFSVGRVCRFRDWF